MGSSDAPLAIPSFRPSAEETRELDPRAEPAQPGEVIGGRFRLDEELGHGSQGRVYRARDLHLHRDVALKLLRTDAPGHARERFVRESKAIAELGHSGIVTVYEAGVAEDGSLYYAMELVGGRSLEAFFRDEAPLEAGRLGKIVASAARAVHHAHEAGLIHRDLKPGNLLLDREEQPKIADFGLVSLSGGTRLTATRSVVGTPVYMAPEQAEGRTIDRRADVYALGVILYEGLVGRPPFLGDTPLEILRKVVDEEPTPPRELRPEISELVERVILRALDKQPRLRYATAAAFARDLGRALKGTALAPEALRPRVERQVSQLSRRGRRWFYYGLGGGLAGGLALGAALGFGAGWSLGGGSGAAGPDSGVGAASLAPLGSASAEQDPARLIEQARREWWRAEPGKALSFLGLVRVPCDRQELGRSELRVDADLELLRPAAALLAPESRRTLAEGSAVACLARLDRGQGSQAQVSLSRALALEASNPLTRAAAAAVAYREGRDGLARGLLQKALEERPGLGEALLVRGLFDPHPRARGDALDEILGPSGGRWRALAPRALVARIRERLAQEDWAGARAEAQQLVTRLGESERGDAGEWPPFAFERALASDDPLAQLSALTAKLKAGVPPTAPLAGRRPLTEELAQARALAAGQGPAAPVSLPEPKPSQTLRPPVPSGE